MRVLKTAVDELCDACDWHLSTLDTVTMHVVCLQERSLAAAKQNCAAAEERAVKLQADLKACKGMVACGLAALSACHSITGLSSLLAKLELYQLVSRLLWALRSD